MSCVIPLRGWVELAVVLNNQWGIPIQSAYQRGIQVFDKARAILLFSNTPSERYEDDLSDPDNPIYCHEWSQNSTKIALKSYIALRYNPNGYAVILVQRFVKSKPPRQYLLYGEYRIGETRPAIVSNNHVPMPLFRTHLHRLANHRQSVFKFQFPRHSNADYTTVIEGLVQMMKTYVPIAMADQIRGSWRLHSAKSTHVKDDGTFNFCEEPLITVDRGCSFESSHILVYSPIVFANKPISINIFAITSDLQLSAKTISKSFKFTDHLVGTLGTLGVKVTVQMRSNPQMLAERE